MNKLVIILILSIGIQSIITEVSVPSRKCFLMTVFANENLLIEIETPLFKERVAVSVQVFQHGARGGPLFEKSIKKSNDRITVKPASAVNSAQLEYQTCVQTTADKPINQTYLISLEQFRNFSHIIQDKQTTNKNINLDDIEKWGGRIAQLYDEETSLYHSHEHEEALTEKQLLQFKNIAYIYSLAQTVVIVAFTIIEVALISKYI